MTSFDGTALSTTLFRPAGDAPAPLVLRTHGWGGTDETTLSGAAKKLVDAGYAVLLRDSRGFGQSGGEVDIDNPLYEGKDASALIDWAVANGVVTLDRTGDPVVGMTGGSYAGGVQTASAAFDDRVDAIAPEISWRDLRYSLRPVRVIEVGWVSALYGAGSSLDHDDAHSTRLDVPTPVMQGSVDTLFNLTEGYGIYEHAVKAGAPATFIAFCGGHVSCPAGDEDARDRAHLDGAILTWFAKHLCGDEKADTGAPVEYGTNVGGDVRSADGFAPSDATPLTAAVDGSLLSTAAETSALSSPGLGSVTTRRSASTGCRPRRWTCA